MNGFFTNCYNEWCSVHRKNPADKSAQDTEKNPDFPLRYFAEFMASCWIGFAKSKKIGTIRDYTPREACFLIYGPGAQDLFEAWFGEYVQTLKGRAGLR